MDRIGKMIQGGIPDDIQAMFPEGIPDVSELQGAVGALNEEELTTRATAGLADVDQATLKDFGSMMGNYAGKQGVEVPAGVSEGNASDIGAMLSSAMKGQDGLGGALQMVQDASGGGGILDSVMDAATGGKFDLLEILKDPKIAGVIGPVMTSIMKK